jgi:hypothetical protein
MRRTRSGLGLIALLVANAAAAQDTNFRRIVETGVVEPGVNVNFDGLQAPAFDGREVAYCAQSFTSFGKNGIYKAYAAGNGSTVIATDSTAAPSGGTFNDMCISSGSFPTIDDGDVAFTAYTDAQFGVFLHDGTLSTVVDDDTTFPGTTATPLGFDPPSLDGRIAVTWTSSPQNPFFAGVFSFDSGGLFSVADTNPAVPTTFFNVSYGTVGGATYVWAVNQTPSGPSFIYRRRYAPLGDIELIASEGQQLADDKFVASPLFPQADRSDGDQLCFVGGAPISAVYRFDGADVELIADTTTPIPDGTGNFTGFGIYCAIDAGAVVFQASGSSGQNGVYIGRANDSLDKVIDTSDSLDGETPSQFLTGREAISNGRVAFVASAFGQSIWVPEPGNTLAGVVALVALAVLTTRRG